MNKPTTVKVTSGPDNPTGVKKPTDRMKATQNPAEMTRCPTGNNHLNYKNGGGGKKSSGW